MTEKVDFDKYTETYTELLREGTGFFTSDQEYFAKYKIELVRASSVRTISRILEYGCGIGRNIPYLQAAFPGVEIVGTDISRASLAMAARDHPAVQFSPEGVDTELGVFDLIFVAGVFHHIPVHEREGAANILSKRLSTGGELYVFEHNPYNPVTVRIVDACPYDADARLLKPSELCALLARQGLHVKKRAYCLFLPPVLGRVRSLESLLTWLPLGGQYWIKATLATV